MEDGKARTSISLYISKTTECEEQIKMSKSWENGNRFFKDVPLHPSSSEPLWCTQITSLLLYIQTKKLRTRPRTRFKRKNIAYLHSLMFHIDLIQTIRPYVNRFVACNRKFVMPGGTRKLKWWFIPFLHNLRVFLWGYRHVLSSLHRFLNERFE